MLSSHQSLPNGLQLKPLDRTSNSPKTIVPIIWHAFVPQVRLVPELLAGLLPVGNGAVVVEVPDLALRLVGVLAREVLRQVDTNGKGIARLDRVLSISPHPPRVSVHQLLNAPHSAEFSWQTRYQ